MVSKSYVPNHSLHKHYYGQGMARFKGSCMQYGNGLGSIFKRVALPLLSKGPKMAAPHVLKAAKGIERAGGIVTGWLCNGTHAKTEETKRYKEKNDNKGDHFDEKAQTRHIRYILFFFLQRKIIRTKQKKKKESGKP